MCCQKSSLKPAPKHRLTRHLIDAYGVSERRACKVLKIHRWTYRYRSCRTDYNEHRPHTSLGNQTPEQFETE